MSKTISCPTCQTLIDLDEALSADLEKQLQEKYQNKQKEMYDSIASLKATLENEKLIFDEKKRNENELFQKKLHAELDKKLKEQELKMTEQLKNENEAQIDLLRKQNEANEAKLKTLNEKEFEVLQLRKQLQETEEDVALKLKKLRFEMEIELKEKISTELLQKERAQFDLERKERDITMAKQKKMIEELQQQIHQGSMQLQGEAQELILEDMLKQHFPFDEISEVLKGKRGADCILLIRNEMGHECGKIIFESKRTKHFENGWLPKLKQDALTSKCDASVLVSKVVPEHMQTFDLIEGVWVCRFSEVISVVRMLREGICNVYKANKSNENKGEKKEMLYNYFTSNEFVLQMRAINEAYLALKSSLDKERFQMEKIWKEREKQIDRVLLNNNHLLGSIKGIAGNDILEIE
ncbi:MAG: DUF2130 domain-containing protein [Chitinophagaceae bacterium]